MMPYPTPRASNSSDAVSTPRYGPLDRGFVPLLIDGSELRNDLALVLPKHGRGTPGLGGCLVKSPCTTEDTHANPTAVVRVDATLERPIKCLLGWPARPASPGGPVVPPRLAMQIASIGSPRLAANLTGLSNNHTHVAANGVTGLTHTVIPPAMVGTTVSVEA